MQTFTPQRLAEMGQLFAEEPLSPYELQQTVDRLYRDAENAGVGDVAQELGLTLDQWKLVRDPIRTLRAAVLAKT